MQMPRGVPVATVAVNNATNAGLLAVRMLGVANDYLLSRFPLLPLPFCKSDVKSVHGSKIHNIVQDESISRGPKRSRLEQRR